MPSSEQEIMILHIEELCRRHGIRILERRRHGGWAARRQRIISIRPVKTQRTYIIALHEIGHIVGAGRSGTRLEQEAGAWEFVLGETAVRLSPVSYDFMRKALDSYLARARRRKGMVVPAEGDWFWHIYHTITAGMRKG